MFRSKFVFMINFSKCVMKLSYLLLGGIKISRLFEKEVMDEDGFLVDNGKKVTCLRLAKLIVKKELMCLGYSVNSNGKGVSGCYIVYDNFGSYVLKPCNVVVVTLGRCIENNILILYWEDMLICKAGKLVSIFT